MSGNTPTTRNALDRRVERVAPAKTARSPREGDPRSATSRGDDCFFPDVLLLTEVGLGHVADLVLAAVDGLDRAHSGGSRHLSWFLGVKVEGCGKVTRRSRSDAFILGRVMRFFPRSNVDGSETALAPGLRLSPTRQVTARQSRKKPKWRPIRTTRRLWVSRHEVRDGRNRDAVGSPGLGTRNK